jgi:cytochrome oxidase assembly protein ShyY1
VLLICAVAACWWLGSWQWDRGHTEIVRTPPPGVAELTDVHSVGDPVDPADSGRRVRVTGIFDPARQVQVIDRTNHEELGSWVVTALEVRVSPGAPIEGTAHAAVPVVRGWLPAGEAVPTPPTGEQHIQGWLEPTEPDTLRDPEREPLPADQLEIISSPELLSLWRPPLYQGFVIQERPRATAPLQAVSPPQRVTKITDWQNTAYAIQWWLFGLFAVFWFGRMIRVEAEDRRSDAATGGSDHPEGIGRMEPADATSDEASHERGSA